MPPLQGSGAEVGQVKEVKCTYANCQKRFDTEKEMKRHKLSEPEHNYCKKCNVDCVDWEALTQHKVDMMSEFMNDKYRAPDAAPKHITCEFCGEDFKSFGGRKSHRTQNHQAEQSLDCPAKDQGCSGLFNRASSMIAHLEQGHCRFISAQQFQASVQHKHILPLLFQHIDVFSHNLSINKAPTTGKDEQPGLITDGSELLDHDEGGVSLGNHLDRDDEAQRGGYRPLQPAVDELDGKAARTRSNVETWPRLPGQAPTQLAHTMREMSIASGTASVDGTDSEYGSDITSRRGGTRVQAEGWPSLSPPPKEPQTAQHDPESNATAPAAFAWSTGHTTQALFHNPAPHPPVAGDWSAIAQRKEDALLAASRHNNMLYIHFYDPSSADYDPALFFHCVLQQYCCPFPDCGDSYAAAADLAAHLQSTHLRRSYNCTLCLKRFQSAAALVGHLESAGTRCRVQDSNNYKKLLDEISGGFLKAKRLEEPKIYRPEAALMQAGKPAGYGVVSVEFKAKMPEAR